MKTQHLIVPLFAVCGLSAALISGCTRAGMSDTHLHPGTDPVEIVLGGGIAPQAPATLRTARGVAQTRAIVNAQHGALDVSFARLDQQTDGSYAGYGDLSTALPATIAEHSGDGDAASPIAFDTPQYYLTRRTENNTRFVGWYPRSTPSAGVVTIGINGQNDIMLSQELEGNQEPGSQFGASGKVFLFAHCLTQLKIKAYGADARAVTLWGGIEGITLRGLADHCRITLPATVEFDGSADLPLPARSWEDDAPIAYPLTFHEGLDAAVACGYALIGPLAAGEVLTLVVATEKRGDYEIGVSVPTGGFQNGYAYEIVLKFKNTTIEPAIADWEEVTWDTEIGKASLAG